MRIAGYASTPHVDKRWRSVSNDAFGAVETEDVRLYLDHDETRIAGTLTLIERRERGLWAEAVLAEGQPGVARVASDIRAGKQYGFSIGAKRLLGWRLISRVALFEISVTEHPANPECLITWVDRPAVKLWPKDLADVYAEQDAAAELHKHEIEDKLKWLTANVSGLI
ncbi:HK97 family phage prohead protease [Bradyrhizobium sp. LjRoot220]|uniref:HK97 family phage prohead protease n=1 Tax=Bradyrhizobium sp. LjRoot220 TaxID=3342284 RepID=UPI003ECEC85C